MKDERFGVVPPLKSRSVTVVIAALNEAANLTPLLLAIEQTFKKLGFILPVLLIDDGSTDDTPQILAQLQEQYAFLKVVRHPHRKGLTEALETALIYTHSDWLYLSAADLESDIQTDLPLLLSACVSEVDAVAGWRQGRKDGKKFASWFANLSCRLAFGLTIHDMNWIKLLRRDLLAALPLEQVTHCYLLPVLAGWGYQIVEVPTTWHPRKAGKSKFGRQRLMSSARNFLQLWWWFQIEGRKLNPSRHKLKMQSKKVQMMGRR